MQELILGSASRYRQKVLKNAGYVATPLSADIDEKAIRRGNAVDLTIAIAQAKAAKLVPIVKFGPYREDALLVTCDQIVRIYDDQEDGEEQIYEKPSRTAEAVTMLWSYGDIGWCETVSSIVVTRVASGEQVYGVDIVKITFDPIPKDRIDAAVTRGKVMFCCGALMCEDPDIKPFIKKMYGPSDSVDGMPLFLLERLLAPFRE